MEEPKKREYFDLISIFWLIFAVVITILQNIFSKSNFYLYFQQNLGFLLLFSIIFSILALIKQKRKFLAIITLVLTILAFLVLPIIVWSGFNIIDELTPSGIQLYSDKDVTISEIESSTFYELKGKSDNCTNKIINTTEGYAESYSLFNYGIFLIRHYHGIDFLDIKTNKIIQFSDGSQEYRKQESIGFDVCESEDYAMVRYTSQFREIWDGHYNKGMKVALFTKNEKKKIIAEYVRKNSADSTIIDNEFWYENKFYFMLDHQNSKNEFYVVEILNNDFKEDNLFYE